MERQQQGGFRLRRFVHYGRRYKIRININAYSGTKGLTLNALSHELTHFIKQWSPDKYKALAEYLIKTYEGTDMTMHKRVVREQNRLKEIRKEDVSYDEAYDEVVANAFNRLLEDGKVMERIAEIRQMDKSLADKIIEKIRDFIKRFTNAYRKNPSYFRDSEALMEMKEAVDQLQEMFAEALVEASDNFRAAQTNETGSSEKMLSSQQAELNRITLSMTDSERTAILHRKIIEVEVYDGQAEDAIERNKADLTSNKIGLIKSALERIGDQFNVIADYNIADIEVKVTLSKNNLRESVSKDITPEQIARLMPAFRTAVENAVGIESHANRYLYDTDIVRFDNLVGGYIEGDSFVPVRFGLKHRRSGEAILYVIVDQQKIPLNKIKAEVVKTADAHTVNVRKEASRSAYKISLADIVPFVNGKDLLRYLPDDMLDSEQKRTKWTGIAETIKKTNNKNDKHYADYIRKEKQKM